MVRGSLYRLPRSRHSLPPAKELGDRDVSAVGPSVGRRCEKERRSQSRVWGGDSDEDLGTGRWV